MAQAANPYYNPVWNDAAKNIAGALIGDPEKAGAIAYQKASARLAQSKASRQDIENQALLGLQDALAGGNSGDPSAVADNMPAMLARFAQGGINDPSKFFTPQWAIRGESMSGASPAEALVRAAYAGGGHAIPEDLALTPQRSDDIRQQGYAAALERAIASATISANSPGKIKAPGANDIDSVLAEVFSGIKGATETDQYKRTHLTSDVMENLSASPAMETIRRMAADNLASGSGSEAARAQIVQALGIEPGTEYHDAVDNSMFGRMLGYAPDSEAGFYNPSGEQLDFTKLLQMVQPGAAPAMPAPAAPGNAGMEAVYQQARDAIAQGANPQAVAERLRASGLDPGGL